MFEIALIIGLYSYLILFFGFFGFLYRDVIIILTIIYLLFSLIFLIRRKLFLSPILYFKRLDKLSKILIFIVIVQGVINFIGVLGPEISFDALWYHLTLPKLYLENHQIFYIPGNLLYYSTFPKVTEMLYIGGLSFGSEIIPKIIHFSFGILTFFSIYKISIKFVSKQFSILAILIFYSSLVVGWESVTAYVDLSRTFFESMSLLAFLNWYESKQNKWLIAFALMLGLAVSVKLISLSSLIIFLGLFAFVFYKSKSTAFFSIKKLILPFLLFLLVPLPWFIFSFLSTGNFVYPYFTNLAVDSGSSLVFPNIYNFFSDVYTFFLKLNDPISPAYLIFLPIVLITFKNFNTKTRLLLIYTLISVFLWYLTQQARGGRFIMPYLPIFSILIVSSINLIKLKQIKKISILVIIFVAVISISYRSLANFKFVPVILGMETKQEFLINNLNFSFGDFYDIDGYFKTHIKPMDRVLLYGFHNLYYVEFPYIDSSWIKKGDKFNYIAVQNTVIPNRFLDWKEIYYNTTTKVKLYSKEGIMWQY